jgi:hypothetical protein
MKLVALTLALFALVASAPTPHARVHHAGAAGAAPSCPYAASTDDGGCAGAPAGASIQHADFFSGYAQQSGQTWKAPRPARNEPGVDYAVGYVGPLKNILTSPPAGCTVTNPSGYRRIQCGAASGATTDLTLSGYDFCQDGGSSLEVGGYRNVTITNSHFCGGTNVNNAPDACAIRLDDNNGAAASTVTLKNDEIDGNTQVGPGAGLLQYMVCDKRANASTKLVVEYVACLDAPGKCWTWNENDGSAAMIEWNYVETLSNPGGSHGETIQTETYRPTGAYRPASFTEQHNVELQSRSFTVTCDGAGCADGTPGHAACTGGGGNRCGGAEAFIDMASFGSATVNFTGPITISGNVWVANKQAGTGQVGLSRLFTSFIHGATLIVTNNVGDPTGALGCLDDTAANYGSATVSGNVNLTDNSPMNSLSATTQCNNHARFEAK